MLVASIFDQAWSSLGRSLPGIAGALLLLVVGLLVAWVVGRVGARALAALGLDRLSQRFGIDDVTRRLGLAMPLSRLVGRAIRITLSVVVIIAALSALGLAALGQSLNQAVLFIPKVLVALALVLLGVVVGEWVARRADRVADQMNLAVPLGRLAYVVVFSLFLLTALAEVGIPTAILTAILGVLVLAAALTLSLAFGLGGREVARQLSAGRYVSGSFELGQTISVAGVRGRIVALETAAAVLRADDGTTVRVPNNLLLEAVVTVHEEGGGHLP